MTLVVSYKRHPVFKRRSGNKNVGIADQLACSVEIGIDIGGLNDDFVI